MAEYVMGPDDNQQDVAQDLIKHAGPDRAHEIEWNPRPNVPGGGVFVMPDDLAEGYTSDRVSRVSQGSEAETETEKPSARTRRQQARAADADTTKE